MTPRLKLGSVAAAICVLSGIAPSPSARLAASGWHEIAWPFLRDGWPAGRAFRCSAASCGDEIELYLRPKLGFCNCDTGVADDEEVDRVTDLDLLSDRFAALGPGKVVRVAEMAGRIRQYDLRLPDGSQRPALGIAASRQCDLMVAVAVGKATAPTLQGAVLEFLGSS